MRRLSATFEEMEKAIGGGVQVYQTASSSSSSSVSDAFKDDLVIHSIYTSGESKDSKDRDERDVLSLIDDQLELGAEGKSYCI